MKTLLLCILIGMMSFSSGAWINARKPTRSEQICQKGTEIMMNERVYALLSNTVRVK